MRGFVLAVAVVLAGATMAAQTVESVINLSAFGWGPISIPQAIETDGDLTTREWLVRRLFAADMRVVAERNGGICAGPWFVPSTLNNTSTVQRVGLVHKLVSQRSDGRVEIMSFDTPHCP